MDIIRDLSERLDFRNPVITIGNFDGVHRGHQKIFKKVVEHAREVEGTPSAMTFDPHPVRVVAPEKGLKVLTTFDDKAGLISGMGIDLLLCIRFDRDFAGMTPDDFIKKVLVEKIGAKWVIVGHNYAFGKGKKGTTDLLRKRGEKYGFKVTVVRYATVHGDIVSSSRIRSLLLRGRVCEASQMLGRAYHIEGTVIRGAGRGTPLLQTPTANIHALNELIPKEGVYAVKVSLKRQKGGQSGGTKAAPSLGEGKVKGVPSFDGCRRVGVDVYDGVANIGKNPTFGEAKMSYEVHLFNFKGNLLGERLRVHFIDRIRDERRFPDIKALKDQIRWDIEKAGQIMVKKVTPLYL